MSDSLFTELKRRNVFKVGTAYLVLAWVVIQVTSEAVPAMHLPDWVNSFVFFLGAIGFPFALFFAWAFEITPEGVKRESDVNRDESITQNTSRKLDFLIIGCLILGMGYFIWESRFDTESTEAVISVGSSIAVLPFVNMSSDPEQEYFSDGISEEILNVLAQIPNLHVTSRSSAFAFKGKDINISEVAKILGVKNILEGSVRKSGNRIRITAQLIEAKSDKHLWSETYDRELVDIFKIQDEISAAIVKALKSKLGLEVEVVARDMEAVNLEAHNEYLQGRFYVEKRTQKDLEKALLHFDKAIEIAPDYAPAWMGKAWASHFLSELNYGNIPNEVAEERARAAVENAIILDPELPEAYAIRGLIESTGNNSEIAILDYKKAIELNPNYADAYVWYASTQVGFPKKKLELFEKAVQLSPMSLLANYNYGVILSVFGRLDDASEVVQHMLDIDDASFLASILLGKIKVKQGKLGEAAFYIQKTVYLNPTIGYKVDLAFNLSRLGLPKLAAEALNDTGFEALGLLWKNNHELFISETRALFPRSETDNLGAFIRGLAEVQAGNYKDAIKYLKGSYCRECAELIFSYLQVGDSKSAMALIDKQKIKLESRLKAGEKYLEITIIILAFLEGDIEQSLQYLQDAMKNGYIIESSFRLSPIYKQLRAHPDWPAILAESDERAAVQREIYLKLLEGAETIL